MQDAIKQIPTIIFKQQFSTKDRRRNKLHERRQAIQLKREQKIIQGETPAQ